MMEPSVSVPPPVVCNNKVLGLASVSPELMAIGPEPSTSLKSSLTVVTALTVMPPVSEVLPI